jgi:hypothetical protein
MLKVVGSSKRSKRSKTNFHLHVVQSQSKVYRRQL